MTGAAESAPAYPAENGTACRCGAGPHPDRAGRCASGHPLAGHGGELSKRHGLHASTLASALVEERRFFLAGSLADDGGADEVPTRRRSLHEYRARLHVHVCALSDALEHHGQFDRRGRLRVAWLQRLEGLIATAHRLDATLGLSRRARPVPSLDEALAAVSAEGRDA